MANTFNDVLSKPISTVWTIGSELDVTGGAPCRVMGFTVSGAAAATALIHDSTATDNAVFTIKVAGMKRTAVANFAPQGVSFANGLSLEESAGTLELVVDYIQG